LTLPADAWPAVLLPLAFQVWDAVGWLGQALFTARMLHQWLASEAAGRSVLPAGFWWLSLAGSVALLVYQFHRRDPVFLAGVGVNTAIAVRNLLLVHRPAPAGGRRANPLSVALLGLGGVALLAFVVDAQVERDAVRFDLPAFWLAWGFTAQAVWSGRFVLQWSVSERLGRSVLPASFFWISTVGALMLLAYAVYRLDWVMMAAYALNPVPYVRNLVLIRRQRRAPG
jgi:lipid-A-disaccharide synthase-like uncharacterized protein